MGGTKGSFNETIIDTRAIIKNIDWANELSGLKKIIFFYPTEEVNLEFNSFNKTKVSQRKYDIFSLKFDTKKYDLTCIKIILDEENIIYSLFKDSFDVKFDLIIDELTNKNAIRIKTKRCLIKH